MEGLDGVAEGHHAVAPQALQEPEPGAGALAAQAHDGDPDLVHGLSWRGACFTASPDESSFLRRGTPACSQAPRSPMGARALGRGGRTLARSARKVRSGGLYPTLAAEFHKNG